MNAILYVAVSSLVLSQAAEQVPEPTSVARQYGDIVSTLVRSAGSDEGDPSARMTLANERFRALIQSVEEAGTTGATADDYLALSECSLRLKENAKALAFAQKAVAIAKNIHPYIALVRSLCSAGRVDEAELTIIEATARWPNAEKLYILHNVLAATYRQRECEDKSYNHLEKVIALIIPQLDRDQFYVSHMRRCLQDIYVMNDKHTDFRLAEQCKMWSDSINEEIGIKVSNGGGDRCSLQQIISMRRLSQALIAVNSFAADDSGDRALARWGVMLCDVIAANDTAAVVEEIYWFALECCQAFGPRWELEPIERCLVSLLSALEGIKGATSVSFERGRIQVMTAMEVVKQSKRQRDLSTRDFSDWLCNDEAKGVSFVLIHVTSPLSSNFKDDLQAVLIQQRILKREPKIGVKFVSVPWAQPVVTGGVNHKQAAVAVTKLQESALAGLSGALKLPSKCVLLEPEKASILDVQTFPVNILVDNSGCVVSALTGTGPQPIDRLIRLARSGGRVGRR